VKNWLDCWARRVVINGLRSNWKLVTSAGFSNVNARLVPFNIFIIALDNEMECTLVGFLDDTNWKGKVIDMLEGWAAIHRDHSKREE